MSSPNADLIAYLERRRRERRSIIVLALRRGLLGLVMIALLFLAIRAFEITAGVGTTTTKTVNITANTFTVHKDIHQQPWLRPWPIIP